MKILIDHINKALKIGKNLSRFSTYSCQPKTKYDLFKTIRARISKEGPNCDLNDIDTSLITNMSELFVDSIFNGDISRWNTSNVEDMWGMFAYSDFDGNISKWDVSNAMNTSNMFRKSKFNQDISNWKINKNCDIDDMFFDCPIKEEHKPKALQK